MRALFVDDDPRVRPLAAWLVRAALAIPCGYHGAWNLSHEGALFWRDESGLPMALRWLVGVAELCAALSLATGVLSRAASLGLCLIFAGAIRQHFSQGFSFKHGGYEAPLVYLLLALALLVSRGPTRARPGA